MTSICHLNSPQQLVSLQYLQLGLSVALEGNAEVLNVGEGLVEP